MAREKLAPILVYVTAEEREKLQGAADANLRSLSSECRLALRAWTK